MSKIIKYAEIEERLGLAKAVELTARRQTDADGPVLKKDVLEAKNQADVILGQAKQEAGRIQEEVRRILARAEKEYEMEKKRGAEEGYQEGLARATEVIAHAETEREKIISQSEQEIVTLIQAVTEKVIGRAVEQGAVVSVVKKALSQIIGNKVTVRVSPDDLKFLKEKERELITAIDHHRSLSFCADPTVTPGGCVVDSELGTIDAQLPQQLKAIKKALGL
ncbi:MAG: FliH/SctL family protein [bacterium]|nr:FliH/SctL family protein [bacterium]